MRFNPMLDKNETMTEAIEKLKVSLRVPPKRRDKTPEATSNPDQPILPADPNSARAPSQEGMDVDHDDNSTPATIAPGANTHPQTEQEEKGDIVPKRPPGESKLKSGEDVKSIHWHVGKIYILRPPEAHVGDDCLNDFFLMKVREWDPQVRATRTRKATKAEPPILQFYRSHHDLDDPESRIFYPVYRDTKTKETFWRGVTDKSKGYTPWQIAVWPRMVLDHPFDLQHGRIPIRVWDEIAAEGISNKLIGAPPPGKYIPGKLGQANKVKGNQK